MLYYKILFSLIFIVYLIWFVFVDEPTALIYENSDISITMLGASIVAGGTSLGGGAVAFPIFTKILQIPPDQAVIFSLMIQSVGMTFASVTILFIVRNLNLKIILWASMGGIIGIFLGIILITPILPSLYIKITFTSIIFSLMITILKIRRKKTLYCKDNRLKQKDLMLIFIFGVVGGIISGISGNGIDVIIFSLLVLYFNFDIRKSTQYSIIIMAINAIFGFYIHYSILNDVSSPVFSYWLASIPVVIIGAPLGAIICNNILSQKNIENALILLIFVEFISTLLLLDFSNYSIIYFFFFVTFMLIINHKLYSSKNTLAYDINSKTP